MERSVAVVLLAALVVTPIAGLVMIHAEAPPAIYKLLSTPVYRVFPINSSYVVVATSTYNGKLLLYNVITRRIAGALELYGKIVSIAASSTYGPRYIAVGTSRGELAILENPSKSFKITSIRFHGSTTIKKVGASSNLIYALVSTGAITRFLVIEPHIVSWCEISPYWTNMLLSSKPQTIVLDFVQALTPSGANSFRYSNVVLLAVRHIYVAPRRAIFLNIVPVINKTIVPKAIVKVSYNGLTLYYNLSKTKAIPIPITVHKVTVAVYYFNASNGLTYYGSTVLTLPRLPAGAHLLLTIELKKTSIAIPLPTTKYRLLIVNFSNIYSCSKALSHPLANISIPLLWGSHLALNLFYLNHNTAIIVAYIKSALTNTLSLNVYVINITSHRVIWRGLYPISTVISASAISRDGQVLAVGLSNGILYVLKRLGKGFLITASYRLPSTPSSIRILDLRHSYLLLVGCRDGSLVILLVNSFGRLVPVNRGSNTLALKLGTSPLYIASTPSGKYIVVSSNEGLFLIANLVQNLNRIIGSNLALYLTKPMKITISSSIKESFSILLQSIQSAIPMKINASIRNTLNVPAIAIGVHKLVIKPASPLQPTAYMKLYVNPRSVGIETSFRVFNLTLPFRAYIKTKNGTKVLATNTTVLNATVTYGKSEDVMISFNPIHVMGYTLRIFNSARISIATSRYLSISLALPTWTRAKTVSVCLRPPRGTVSPSTVVAIVGVLSHAPIILSYNARTGCFVAHNVPYDVYRIELVKAPPAYMLPHNAILVVDRSIVRYIQPLLLKPVAVSLKFIPAPKTELKIVIGPRTIYVKPHTHELKLKLYPGIYTLRIEPLPTLYTFNKALKIPFYKPLQKRIAVFTNRSIEVKLVPDYIWVTIVVVDKYTHSPPIHPLKLYINGVYVTTITGHNYRISGYIPNSSTTTVKIVPLTPCYKEVKMTIVPTKMHLHNGSRIYIAVPRNKVKLVLEIYSTLGTPIDGALIGIRCGPFYSTASVSVNGKATVLVPAYTSCLVSVQKLGYYSKSVNVFVGPAETRQLIVLKPTPLTIVEQYINIIAAGIVIGAVIAIALYLKKRIEQKLASATAAI